MGELHTCHAIDCTTPVPRRMFMCRRHWGMLSKEDQNAVWAAYTPGQENDWSKVTMEYLTVTMDIINRLSERVEQSD